MNKGEFWTRESKEILEKAVIKIYIYYGSYLFAVLSQPILFSVFELLHQFSGVATWIRSVSVEFALFFAPTLARSGMGILVGHRVVLNLLFGIHVYR